MFNDTSSPIALLRTRRSGKPRDLVSPGPDAAQIEQILAIAMRTPDHGKLAPWKFVVIGTQARGRFADLLKQAMRAERPDASEMDLAALDQFAHQAPVLIAVLSAPIIPSKIPLWEQHLSAGAAIMNMEHAAHALGFAAGWLTGWPAYNQQILAALGGHAEKGDQIAGFVFIGTPARPLEERPRPAFDSIVSHWTGA